LEPRGLGARLRDALVVLRLALALQLLEQVRGLLPRRNREPLRQQVVPGVARLDVDERALRAHALQVFEQDDVHRFSSPESPAGSSRRKSSHASLNPMAAAASTNTGSATANTNSRVSAMTEAGTPRASIQDSTTAIPCT